MGICEVEILRKQMQLRDYQKQILNKTWQALETSNKILVSAPTGSGKTRMASALIDELLKHGHRVAFIVDRIELIQQSYNTFDKKNVSIVKAGQENLFDEKKPIQLIMIQSFHSRKDKLPDMELSFLIFDEVHNHWGTKRANELIKIYDNAKIIGLSASPLDSKGYLLAGFDEYISEVQTADLIKLGFLAKPITFAPENCIYDLDGVGMVGDDYNNKEVDKIVIDLQKVKNIVDNWKQIARDKKTLVFANSIKHAEMLYAEFKRQGFNDIDIIHSQIDDLKERRKSIKDKQIIINCGILTTGYDDDTIECVLLARPTAILKLYIQIVGRGLRVNPNKKECIILDCANCVSKHGLPDDLRYYAPRKPRNDEPLHVCCPSCGSIEPIENKQCSICGYDLRIIIEQGQGKPQPKKALERLVLVKSMQDEMYQRLRDLVKERGYKNGYAYYLFKDLLMNAKSQGTGLSYYKKMFNRIEKCRTAQTKPYLKDGKLIPSKPYSVQWLKRQ